MSDKNSLKTLKNILRLVEAHKLDELEFNGIKIKKSKHVHEVTKAKTQANGVQKQETLARIPTSIEEIDRMNREAMGIS